MKKFFVLLVMLFTILAITQKALVATAATVLKEAR